MKYSYKKSIRQVFSKSFKTLDMKIEQAHIDQIRKQFAELQSKDDLVKLLSDAKNMLYGEECKPVQLKSLTYYANPTLCKMRYQTLPSRKSRVQTEPSMHP